MSNKGTYELNSVVKYYTEADFLQKPEKTIFDQMKGKLEGCKMLDIGVGGGRTTLHYADLVREYIGVDYSISMIESCRKRFPDKENASFKVADARSLEEFSENTFDIILFSFNGIDYVSHDDRKKILEEVKRLLSKNGSFIFSSHNLYSIPELYTLHRKDTILLQIRLFIKLILLFLLNGTPGQLLKKNWAIVNDGVHHYRLRTYYINPIFQIKQLTDHGFKDIKLYSLETGYEISIADVPDLTDKWVYYTCRI